MGDRPLIVQVVVVMAMLSAFLLLAAFLLPAVALLFQWSVEFWGLAR